MIQSLGFDIGESGADGSYGADTEAAVRAWQGSPAFGELRVTGAICMEDLFALIIDTETIPEDG